MDGLGDDEVCIGDQYRIGSALFEVTQPRTTCYCVGIKVAAPRGQFTLDEGTGPLVLVSAGIGVTPVLAILYALRDRQSTRDVWWLHGARNSSEHTFAAEVRALLADLPGARSCIWYSRPGHEDQIGVQFNQPGHLTAEGVLASGAPLGAAFWICGPIPFMDDLRTGLGSLGVSETRIHTEAFGAVSPLTPGIAAQSSRPPHPPEGTPGTGPLVSFVRYGLNVRWTSDSASILELAEACDVAVHWSCRTGVCHTCETGLLEGVVAYAPEPLEPAAPGNLLVCCSRPQNDIAVDL